MTTFTKHRVLLSAILSCVIALLALACLGFYAERVNSHWLNLSAATLSIMMVVVSVAPFLVTVVLAIHDRRRRSFSFSAAIGLGLAVFSLVIPVKIGRAVVYAWVQSRHQMLADVPAPQFDTVDVDDRPEKLADQKGNVVLVNIWATWCGACRAEMPKLDALYRQNKAKGLTVYGLSDEDAPTQRKCLSQIPVTYPLLTYKGRVPRFYKEIAFLPTTFVIDRRGWLQPVGGNSFGDLESTVTKLLNEPQR
jgi:peroxiredoxin